MYKQYFKYTKTLLEPVKKYFKVNNEKTFLAALLQILSSLYSLVV